MMITRMIEQPIIGIVKNFPLPWVLVRSEVRFDVIGIPDRCLSGTIGCHGKSAHFGLLC